MSAKTILILAANPKGSTPLRLDQEVRDIAGGLERSQHRDRFTLKQSWAVRPRDIQRAMLDNNPQIVHFSGHGEGEEGLILEDEMGQPKLVSGAALASLFGLFSDQLECVVLNGCYSVVQAGAIAEQIPYVIGMNQAITDRAAIEFAVGFYDALGAGREVEFAYKMGCAAIQMAGSSDHQMPVLLKQASGAQSSTAAPVAAPSPVLALNHEASPLPSQPQPIAVFVSYSHYDEVLREELESHLSNLRRQGKIAAWNDRAVEAGTEWDAEIKAQLEAAGVILLLVSSRFMASEYCYDIEMKRALERHEEGTARVIPIILKPVDWKDSPFSKLATLPKDAKPITKWDDRDEAFLSVVQGIRRAVESLQAKK
ncbi:MAG: TIR domain-containing protein [Leptolyngbyaceae cyanobacterium CAN_BIN12]|nr:TIR domain-containing protein [Leptolyngbyaceae cyanobacterium CAN_BIN12]